jgi:hypothetical protein
MENDRGLSGYHLANIWPTAGRRRPVALEDSARIWPEKEQVIARDARKNLLEPCGIVTAHTDNTVNYTFDSKEMIAI